MPFGKGPWLKSTSPNDGRLLAGLLTRDALCCSKKPGPWLGYVAYDVSFMLLQPGTLGCVGDLSRSACKHANVLLRSVPVACKQATRSASTVEVVPCGIEELLLTALPSFGFLVDRPFHAALGSWPLPLCVACAVVRASGRGCWAVRQ